MAWEGWKNKSIGSGSVTSGGTLTDNFVVRGNGSSSIDIGNIFMSSDGNDLSIPGILDMTTGLINNVLDPVSAQDAATKNYVDTHTANGLWTKSGINLTTTTANDHITLGDGTELLPAYSFASDTATGMRLSASNILNFSARGLDVLQLTAPASAVNFITMTASTTGGNVGPILTVDGSDTNSTFSINSKGSSELRLNVTGSANVVIGVGEVINVSALGTVFMGLGSTTPPLATTGRVIDFRAGTPNTNSTIRISSATDGNDLDIGINDTATNSGAAFITNTSTNQVIFTTSAGEAMRFTDRMVGINITPSGATLHINNTSNETLKLERTNNNPSIIFTDGTTETRMHYENGNGQLTISIPGDISTDIMTIAKTTGFYTYNDTTFTINTTTKNVGMGVAADSSLGKLHIKTAGTASSVASFADELVIENSGDVGVSMIAGDSSNSHFIFRNQSDNTSATIRYRATGEIFDFNVGTSSINLSIMGSGALAFNTDVIVVDTNKNVAFGTTSPLAKVNILATTEQLRLSYNVTNFASQTVASDAVLTINTSDGTDTGFVTIQPVAGGSPSGVGIMGIGITASAVTASLDIIGSVFGGAALRLRAGDDDAGSQQILFSRSGLNQTHNIRTQHNSTTAASNCMRFYMWNQGTDSDEALGSLLTMTLTGQGRLVVGNSAVADTTLHVLSTDADTTAVTTWESTGANGGESAAFLTNRDPNGNITGAGGALAYRDSGATSASYINLSATTDTVWFKAMVNPDAIKVINTSAEFEALATAGTITVSTTLTLIFNVQVVTSTVFVVSGGAVLNLTARRSGGVGISYIGTGTLISGTGTCAITDGMQIFSGSTGTFQSLNGGGSGFLDIEGTTLAAWTSLGTYTNGIFLMRFSNMVSCTAGFNLSNCSLWSVFNATHLGVGMAGPLFTVNTNISATGVFDSIQADLATTGSLYDFDTRINNNVQINVRSSDPKLGSIYRQSTVSDATINSVANAAIAAGAITAQATDSEGTIHSCTTTYFEDEEVTITGTTSYNGTFQIFDVVVGVSFKTITTFVDNDATGTVNTNRIEMTLAGGHGVTTGMNIKVLGTNAYNAFYTTLNVATNVITLNAIVGTPATATGTIKRDLSIDETDSRANSFNNLDIPDSQTLAFGTQNASSTTTTITDGTYVAITLATFTSSTVSEKMQLRNSTNGIWTFTAIEDFKGFLTGGFWALKSGSTGNYRVAMSIDGAVPVFATASYAPMEVKTTKVSIPLLFSVELTKGQTVQIMVAGDGTGDALTITDLRIGIQ